MDGWLQQTYPTNPRVTLMLYSSGTVGKVGEALTKTSQSSSETVMEKDEHTDRPVEWATVRIDYEAGFMTRNAVAAKHGVPLAEIETRASANKWTRPNSEITDRRILIFKLLGLLERQIDQVDELMKTNGNHEVSVLTNIVRDLDKLITIEKAETGELAQEIESGEMRDLQRKLEKRINAITKS